MSTERRQVMWKAPWTSKQESWVPVLTATNLLCDLGQVIGLSELCLLICLTKRVGQLITKVPTASMCPYLCCLSQQDSHTSSFQT